MQDNRGDRKFGWQREHEIVGVAEKPRHGDFRSKPYIGSWTDESDSDTECRMANFQPYADKGNPVTALGERNIQRHGGFIRGGKADDE